MPLKGASFSSAVARAAIRLKAFHKLAPVPTFSTGRSGSRVGSGGCFASQASFGA
jgi:hypothetical protein